MKPTPGRIVVYRASGPAQINNSAETYPAIVTQVNDGSGQVYCNLLCLPPFAAPFHEGSVLENSTAPRSWFWPPRE